MFKSLPSYDLDRIQEVDEALRLIEINLDEMISMCRDPIVAPKDKKTMNDNIVFVKCYYEKAEALLMKDCL